MSKNLKELKSVIENNQYNGDMIIFKLEDNESGLIATQYIDKISKDKNLEVLYIDSISEIIDSPFIEDNNLYVIHDDKFNDKKTHKNTIVICNDTDLDCYIIPKLENWQVCDFVKSNLVKGMNSKDIEWLQTQYNNYYKFINDISKISVFDKKDQQDIFEEFLTDGVFKDSTSLNIWDLSNALIKKDVNLAKEVLKLIKYIDVEPIGLLTVNYKNFKNILSIQLNSRCTAKDLGITDKQFYVIKKYNCGVYSNDKLKKIFEFLTDLEYKYKYYGLKQSELIDYMICNILGD